MHVDFDDVYRMPCPLQQTLVGAEQCIGRGAPKPSVRWAWGCWWASDDGLVQGHHVRDVVIRERLVMAGILVARSAAAHAPTALRGR